MPAFRILWFAAVAALFAACAKTPPATVPNATLPDGSPLPVDSLERPRAVTPQQTERIRRVEDPSANEPPIFIALTADAHQMQLRSRDGVFENPRRRVTMTALEGQFAPLRGFGVGGAARVIFGGAQVPVYSDAALLVGWRALAADLGFANRRTANILTGGDYDSTFFVFRPGIRGRVNIGQTGLSAHGRAATYIPLPEGGSGPGAQLEGWNIEGGLSYTADWRYPLTASLGMRQEFIQVWNRRQRAGSVVFGVGVLIGRQPAEERKARGNSEGTEGKE